MSKREYEQFIQCKETGIKFERLYNNLKNEIKEIVSYINIAQKGKTKDTEIVEITKEQLKKAISEK